MFCQIKLTKEELVEKEFALKNKLFFKEIKNKFGYSKYYNNLVDGASYYEDELEEKDDKFFKGDSEISKWNVVKRKEKGNLVKLEQFQFINFLETAPNILFKYTIEKTIPIEQHNIGRMLDYLEVLEQKLDRLSKVANDLNFNYRCNVHVGGELMVNFNKVFLKENCCTDELQKHLNDGWRIVATCVQPDQKKAGLYSWKES